MNPLSKLPKSDQIYLCLMGRIDQLEDTVKSYTYTLMFIKHKNLLKEYLKYLEKKFNAKEQTHER